MNTYVVFDGRAEYDIDEAQIVEYMGEYPNDEEALEVALQSWEGYDHVLVGYEGTENELTNVVSKFCLILGTRI